MFFKKRAKKTCMPQSFQQSLRPWQNIKSRWRSDYFENNNPIILELGCGQGDYALALGELFTDKNCIGIDKESTKIWLGAKLAWQKELDNVAFLNTLVEEAENYFDQHEVDEIWLTFPEPLLEPYNVSRCLVSPAFLRIYKQILKPGGLIHLKTNERVLLEYTADNIISQNGQIIKKLKNIYNLNLGDPLLYIKTTYEKHYLEAGDQIHYLQFTLS
jgi:tRNA (guanine-N7-)-methyltransferase